MQREASTLLRHVMAGQMHVKLYKLVTHGGTSKLLHDGWTNRCMYNSLHTKVTRVRASTRIRYAMAGQVYVQLHKLVT
jgi:hypothetical protein